MGNFTTTINGMAYTIELCHDDTLRIKSPNGEEENYTDGLCDCYKQRIILLDNMSEERIKRVLCHELAHAYLYEVYRNDTSNYTEEEVCIFVENFIESIYNTADLFMKYYKGFVKGDE